MRIERSRVTVKVIREPLDEPSIRDPFVPAIILIVLLVNALSKCAITYWRSRDWKLTRAVGGALFVSFLGASLSYLLLLRR